MQVFEMEEKKIDVLKTNKMQIFKTIFGAPFYWNSRTFIPRKTECIFHRIQTDVWRKKTTISFFSTTPTKKYVSSYHGCLFSLFYLFQIILTQLCNVRS